ncbi:MAG: flagellar hook-associated protein FlgK [Clostridiaceae bacterium]|nr:flagellar hook-associated protein FlgK [Clostridiaceae bacterium]
MSSLLTSFNAGVSGLQAAQSGINTSAHNLANTATEGYTRQQNISTDTYYQTYKVTSTSTLQVGSGTSVALIRQIRDQFLDKEYRVETSRLSFYEVLQATEEEVEDIFGEMEGVEFNDALSELWDTVQELSTNPESITNRELFIAQVEAFLEQAQNVYTALKDYQVNLNTQIVSQVEAINSIADQIADLNVQIAKIEASGVENANDLRDARNLLMDELATYTDFEYYESNSQVTIRINNAPLVEDSTSYHMTCEKIQYEEYDENGNLVVTATSPLYTVKWADSGYGEVYNLDKAYSYEDDTDMGSLLGILVARGNNYGYYTDIPTDPTKDELDEYNNTTGSCLLQNIEAQFDLLINKIVTAINDAFAPNVSTNLSGLGIQDADGNEITGMVKVLDATNCPVGTDDDATIGTEVISRSSQERYTTYILDYPVYQTDEDGNQVLDEDGNPIAVTQDLGDGTYKLYVYNEEDPSDTSTLYTLQNLEINQTVQGNYSYLPVKANSAAGRTDEYDYDVFQNILDSWNTEDLVLDPNTLSTYNVNDFYTAMIGALAVQGMTWDSMVDTQTTLVEGVEDKRQQISGVSTEEDMINLLMYQHAYNAASRYITTVDAMLEHLIERLG